MKFMKKISIILLTMVFVASSSLPTMAADQTVSKPSKPQGTTDALNTNAPEVEHPLPIVDNGGNANDSTLKNIANTNPFIKILDGIEQICSLNQPEWREGNAIIIQGVNGED